jgi:hypothetical protein
MRSGGQTVVERFVAQIEVVLSRTTGVSTLVESVLVRAVVTVDIGGVKTPQRPGEVGRVRNSYINGTSLDAGSV